MALVFNIFHAHLKESMSWMSCLLEDLLYKDNLIKFHVYDTQDYFNTI